MLSKMSAVGITENAKGDNKKFEIWCNSREEVYIVQVPDGILVFYCTRSKSSNFLQKKHIEISSGVQQSFILPLRE